MSVHIQDYHRQILHGDVMDRLKLIPDCTFDCIITSPPYWSLRDYSIEGQWGLEPTYQEYLEKMKELMAQLKRVLKNTGSCFINIGDTYGSHKSEKDKLNSSFNARKPIKNLEKSRVGIPERFYINCIDSGWIARNNIPWIKANAFPSPVKDRFTPKWEPVYFFVKCKKYYFNLNAVRVKVQDDKRNNGYHIPNENTPVQKGLCGEDIKNTEPSSSTNKQDNTLGADGKPKAIYKGFNERYNQSSSKSNGKNPGDVLFLEYSNEELLEWINICRKNSMAWDMAPSDLFYINTKHINENHKAIFPVALPLHILKCSCPKDVCIRCGYPKIPKLIPTKSYQKFLDGIKYTCTKSLKIGLQRLKKNLPSVNAQWEIGGYDTCDCNDEFIPGIVLDPFFGSGTTGIAAEKEGLRWCGIELKEEYSEIARKRLNPYVTQGSLLV